MAEDGAAASASEPITTVTGGNKPVHRFLRGQPKIIGVVLMLMAVCLFMFGIVMTLQADKIPPAGIISPFWLAILFFTCGLLYILSERNPSKKMITASLALSIISTIAVISAFVDFCRCISITRHIHWLQMPYSLTDEDKLDIAHYYNPVVALQCMFLCHSLIGGVLLITMSCFARAALRSSNTQAIVVMRSLPSAD